jgi:hypothetical protein
MDFSQFPLDEPFIFAGEKSEHMVHTMMESV